MKHLSALFFSLILALGAFGSAAVSAKNEKVQLCHNLGNGDYILIEVSANAADAHERLHGDFHPNSEGECVQGEPPVEPK